MSIDLIFNDETLGKAPAWDPADVEKLEAALEVLQRRCDLDMDDRSTRPFIRNAVGSVWTVLSFASGDEKYYEEHPDSPSADDLPF